MSVVAFEIDQVGGDDILQRPASEHLGVERMSQKRGTKV